MIELQISLAKSTGFILWTKYSGSWCWWQTNRQDDHRLDSNSWGGKDQMQWLDSFGVPIEVPVVRQHRVRPSSQGAVFIDNHVLEESIPAKPHWRIDKPQASYSVCKAPCPEKLQTQLFDLKNKRGARGEVRWGKRSTMGAESLVSVETSSAWLR